MNQRIKELAKEATIFYSNGQELTFDKRKFAELIIRECADHIMNSTDRYRKEYFANMIKEHFGVEE
jgi:hypothetical protein